MFTGFDYRSNFVWAKDRIGTGYWNRNRHEHLLVGVKGHKIPAPAMGTQWDSLLEVPVAEHSRKPDRFYELIEAYFPSLPRIELNARRVRAGWDRWGNESDPVDANGAPVAHDPASGEVVEDTTAAGTQSAAIRAGYGRIAPAPDAADDGLDISPFSRRRKEPEVAE